MAITGRVVIESRLLPPLDFTVGEAGGPAPNLALRLLKPKVTLYVQGQRIGSTAPLGEPGPTRWPAVRVALLIGAAVLGARILRFI